MHAGELKPLMRAWMQDLELRMGLTPRPAEQIEPDATDVFVILEEMLGVDMCGFAMMEVVGRWLQQPSETRRPVTMTEFTNALTTIHRDARERAAALRAQSSDGDGQRTGAVFSLFKPVSPLADPLAGVITSVGSAGTAPRAHIRGDPPQPPAATA